MFESSTTLVLPRISIAPTCGFHDSAGSLHSLGGSFLFPPKLVDEIDHVLFGFDIGLCSGQHSVGADLLPVLLALITAEGFAHEFTHGAVLLLSEGLGLFEEGRRQGDGDDSGSTHTT